MERDANVFAGGWLFFLALSLCAPASAGETIRIMPLGDSITQGAAGRESYRRFLWQMLQDEGFSVDLVGSQSASLGGQRPAPGFDSDHEGHWGWTVDQVLASVAGWAEASRPDIVLIHLGTNDLGRGGGIDETVQELKDIVLELKRINQNVVVLLAQIIPVGHPSVQERFDAFNGRLPALAADLSTTGSPVVIVDQTSGFDAWRDTYDGVHPSSGGAEKMARAWHRHLAPLLRSGKGAD